MGMTLEDILLNMKEYGFCILEDYWPSEKCEEAIKEILSLERSFEVGQGGDLRFHGANKSLPTANDFLNDKLIQSVADGYSRCNRADRILAGIVRHEAEKTVDSGGGWHVDSEQAAQFKSFVYLSDVSSSNGPFVFIQNSKRTVSKIPKYSNLRIFQEHIDEMFYLNDIIEITGKAGTCILADSTYVHRGKQIEEGIRYTYTNYFYE